MSAAKRGNGQVNVSVRKTLIPNLENMIRLSESYVKESAKIYRNLGDGVPQELTDSLQRLNLVTTKLMDVALKAYKRSQSQATAVAGSPTRRKRKDGKLTP